MLEFNCTDLLPIFTCPKCSRLLFDSFYSFFGVKYYYNLLDFLFYYLSEHFTFIIEKTKDNTKCYTELLKT